MGSVITLDEAIQRRRVCWNAGRRVVFTNGHFDLLHLGHVDYLQRARELGDILIVGLNGDASTRQLKGPQRPLVPAKERALILAALSCVDLVVIFDAPTAEELVRALQPDIYVKGGDWAPAGAGREPPEAAIVHSYGGQVRYIPYLPDHSTTRLIETILERYGRRE
jgi:rfaE bifunctional protein nucleotidyltransferase chain/domain